MPVPLTRSRSLAESTLVPGRWPVGTMMNRPGTAGTPTSTMCTAWSGGRRSQMCTTTSSCAGTAPLNGTGNTAPGLRPAPRTLTFRRAGPHRPAQPRLKSSAASFPVSTRRCLTVRTASVRSTWRRSGERRSTSTSRTRYCSVGWFLWRSERHWREGLWSLRWCPATPCPNWPGTGRFRA